MENISIHAPREGSDMALRYTSPHKAISIHAPREGSDLTPTTTTATTTNFNPRSPRGERLTINKTSAHIG